ncbi:MAG: hypothetical protein IT318_22940 [Anaerolineales bacterium]|nr:hypothetical protein [Anaerolineales bacterium]
MQHTLKRQIDGDAQTGLIVAVAASVPGPTADITLLKTSGLLARLPTGVGALGDLAYVGIADWLPAERPHRRRHRASDAFTAAKLGFKRQDATIHGLVHAQLTHSDRPCFAADIVLPICIAIAEAVVLTGAHAVTLRRLIRQRQLRGRREAARTRQRWFVSTPSPAATNDPWPPERPGPKRFLTHAGLHTHRGPKTRGSPILGSLAHRLSVDTAPRAARWRAARDLPPPRAVLS